jgi:hypothetical protein
VYSSSSSSLEEGGGVGSLQEMSIVPVYYKYGVLMIMVYGEIDRSIENSITCDAKTVPTDTSRDRDTPNRLVVFCDLTCDVK